MLGTKYVAIPLHNFFIDLSKRRYRIEPFFFSSSMNWIPSRYQEEVKKGEGDRKHLGLMLARLILHLLDITIVLPFIRTVHNRGTRWSTALSSSSVTFPPASQTLTSDGNLSLILLVKSFMSIFSANHQIIDTQASLLLRSGEPQSLFLRLYLNVCFRQLFTSPGPSRCPYDSEHNNEYCHIIPPKFKDTGEASAFTCPSDRSERVLVEDFPEIKGSHVLAPYFPLVRAILVG